jgi:hypothetical protein
MKEDIKFIPSTLKVTASENLDVSQDLVSDEPEKTIAELIEKDEEKSEEENKESK